MDSIDSVTHSKGRAYSDLISTLKRQIISGDLIRGERIMAERKLASVFSISRDSVRRGLLELVDEGYLKMIPGEGMFVNRGQLSIEEKSLNLTLGYIYWGSQDWVNHSPYFGDLIRGVEQETESQGFYLMVGAQKKVESGQLPPMVLDKKVDGVILEGGYWDAYQKIKHYVPALMISNFARQEGLKEELTGDMVSIDNQKAFINLFSYLFNLGHRKIGFISPALNQSCYYERYEGYQFALHRYALPFRQEYVLIASSSLNDRSIHSILGMSDRPTAIMAGNDYTAIKILECAENNGIEVPQDLSVTGFDDIAWAELTTPPLTTVNVSPKDMGRLAVRRLIEKIENPQKEEAITLLPGKLVRRSSCASPWI